MNKHVQKAIDDLNEGYVNEAKKPPTDATIKPHMSQYSVADDPYDVAEEIGKEYGWNQSQIEKAEVLIRKKYITESVNEFDSKSMKAYGDAVKKGYGGKSKLPSKIKNKSDLKNYFIGWNLKQAEEVWGSGTMQTIMGRDSQWYTITSVYKGGKRHLMVVPSAKPIH